ncbi:MAG TPA: glucose 1-dehydrogenase [Noviherbaspirillum sp.]|nr:glucose 1-dehydrogenase [Noviherbaspirillum sp.]
MGKLLENKVALVTGAGSGIGRAIALAYASCGAKVMVSDIDEGPGRQTVEQIVTAGGEAVFRQADAARAADHAALVDAVQSAYGALHVACNNAGIGGAATVVGEAAPEDWDRVIAVNLSGVFYGMRYQIPALLRSGGGVIVNMASVLAQVGMREHASYVAAKHGVLGLTRTAALEYAQHNIRINAIGPGFIRTPLLDNLPDEMIDSLSALHPMGRLGDAAEVAELALWLASDKASFVTGSYYAIDGGYLSQ